VPEDGEEDRREEEARLHLVVSKSCSGGGEYRELWRRILQQPGGELRRRRRDAREGSLGYL
jgi:hypothetical protein